MRLIRFYIVLLIITAANLFAGEWKVVRNLSEFNTKGNEFAPVLLNSSNILILNSDKSSYAKFYQSDFNNDTLLNIRLVTGDINKERNNQTYLCFDNDKSGYYADFVKLKNKPIVKLHSFTYEYNKFINGKTQVFFNDNRFVSQPTISPDKNYMVVVAEDPETGKTDLYEIDKAPDGSWVKPELIKILASDGNEITPFLSKGDTLYFASDGYGGKGGFDIFYSYKQDNEWQRPIPLSSINSEFNESDFIIYNTHKGIFASDRSGGAGKLDLYLLRYDNSYTLSAKENSDIKCLTNEIRMKIERQFKRLPFNFYVDYKNTDINEAFIQAMDFQIIYKYLQNNSAEKITLNIRTQNKLEIDSAKNSKFKADNIANFIKSQLVTKYNIDEERIDINYEYTDNPEQTNILILFKNNLNISYIQNKDNIIIEPEKLDFEIIHHINEPLKASIKYGAESEITAIKPENGKFGIKLNKNIAGFSEADSISVTITNENLSLIKNCNLDIIKQIIQTEQNITYNGTTYRIFPFILDKSSDIEKFNLISSIEKETNRKDIVIVFNQLKETAGNSGLIQTTDKLIKLLNAGGFKVNIVNSIDSVNIPGYSSIFYLLLPI